jgi:NAD dependent epimerase/dehydratase family enzyme
VNCGNVLSRPTIISIPRFASRMAFGELADAALLSGVRVLPDLRNLDLAINFVFQK